MLVPSSRLDASQATRLYASRASHHCALHGWHRRSLHQRPTRRFSSPRDSRLASQARQRSDTCAPPRPAGRRTAGDASPLLRGDSGGAALGDASFRRSRLRRRRLPRHRASPQFYAPRAARRIATQATLRAQTRSNKPIASHGRQRTPRSSARRDATRRRLRVSAPRRATRVSHRTAWQAAQRHVSLRAASHATRRMAGFASDRTSQ